MKPGDVVLVVVTLDATGPRGNVSQRNTLKLEFAEGIFLKASLDQWFHLKQIILPSVFRHFVCSVHTNSPVNILVYYPI